MEGGGGGHLREAGLRTCPSSCDRTLETLPMPSLHPANGNAGLVSGDDVVINPEAVNSALAFHPNIYLHPNRRGEGPSPALQRPRKAPQRVNVPMMNGATRDFICQADARVLVFDVLFKCLWPTEVK